MILHTNDAAPAGGSTPPAVILLHGLFGQGRNFGRLQRHLARAQRAVTIDLRSHGASPHGPLDLRAMADDVRETMASLGLDRATLVGHSLGGKVAMAAALAHPDAITRLLVADIAPVAYAHGHLDTATAMRTLVLRDGMSRADADLALAASVPEASVRALLLQNLHLRPRPRWGLGLADIIASLDQAEGWPGFPQGAVYRGRTLFLRGANSDYVLPAHLPAIRGYFPQARVATLHAAGHWLHVDRPDEFTAIVSGFVASGTGAAIAPTLNP